MNGTYGSADNIAQNPSLFRKLIGQVRTAIGDMLTRQDLRAELTTLMEYSGRDGIVDGLGLHRAQLPAFIQGYPNANRLLPRMARRMGIDLKRDADAAARNDMLITCSLCTAQRACRSWMDNRYGTDRPDFCRNGEELDALNPKAKS